VDKYLPVVNPEVGYSLGREISKWDDEPYIDEQLDLLLDKNPTLAVWIREYANRTEDPIGAMMCGLCVYKLLESQAEANLMAEEINLG
jgi:hypothetical protein